MEALDPNAAGAESPIVNESPEPLRAEAPAVETAAPEAPGVPVFEVAEAPAAEVEEAPAAEVEEMTEASAPVTMSTELAIIQPQLTEPEIVAEADVVEESNMITEADIAEEAQFVDETPPAAGPVDDDSAITPVDAATVSDVELRATLEAVVYVTEEPLSLDQLATALGQPKDRVSRILKELIEDFSRPDHGITIKEVAGGFKMSSKPEHHDSVRRFVRNLKPPLKLSLAALETLAVIAYKQPITSPEIMEIRGVQGGGVLKTLLDRKLITTAGRKNVVGKPILYRTTKDFLVQFGLSGLSELPTLKEFEELRRLALTDTDPPADVEGPASAAEAETTPQATPEPAPAPPEEAVAETVSEQ